jgi:hypothetical protein
MEKNEHMFPNPNLIKTESAKCFRTYEKMLPSEIELIMVRIKFSGFLSPFFYYSKKKEVFPR